MTQTDWEEGITSLSRSSKTRTLQPSSRMETTTKAIVTLDEMTQKKKILFFLHTAFRNPEGCVWFFLADEV